MFIKRKALAKKNIHSLSLISVLLSMALILGYIEHLIPILPVTTGIKLGLSNIVLIICLYAIGNKEAILLMLLKVFLSTILFAGFDALLYSLSGGIASIIAMLLGKNLLNLSLFGTSILGAVSHNVAQVLVAILIINLPILIYYMAILMLVGVVTGLLTGLISKILLKHLKPLL